MIKIALCDDDLQELQGIQAKLQRYREQHALSMRVIACQKPSQLLMQLVEHPDTQIVILDVVMPEMNGIHLAQEIRDKYPHIAIVFLTASAEYAVDSYSVHADNYLLKPVEKKTFFACMEGVLARLQSQVAQSITVFSKEGVCRVPLRELVFCEVRNKTIFFHLCNGKTLTCQMVFTDLLETLTPYPQFVKPHRSFVLNLDYVDQISTKEVKLQNTVCIPIAKGNASHVREAFLAYYST